MSMITRSSKNPHVWYDRIVRASQLVLKELGCGRRENAYQQALQRELHCKHRELFTTEVTLPIMYKGYCVASERLDLVLHNIIIVEVKSVSKLQANHEEQVKAYVRDTKLPGVLINFPTRANKIECCFFAV